MKETRDTVKDGDALAWRRLGTGEPLLLINGYAATKDDWDPTFLTQLAAGRSVICPDNRGIGESAGGSAEASIARMADDCLGLLDGLGLDAAAVAGWSMGGFIAQQMAARAPDRIDALVLMSTDPGGKLAARRTPEVHAKLVDHSGSPHEQAERLLGLLFPEEVAARVYEEFGDLVAEARAGLVPEVLDAQERAMERWHEDPAEGRLAAIEAPVLVATGTEDVVEPPSNSELLAAQWKDAWLARFTGCGHAFMAQEPRRLAALIEAFLAR